MVKKRILEPARVRNIQGTFAFLEHRFLRQGFFEHLTQHELLLYLFLVLVSDRQGISYYSYDRICSMTGITLDEYIRARDGLIDTDLLAFDGFFFQVLALPDHVVIRTRPRSPGDVSRGGEPVAVFDLLRCFLPPRERLENASQ
ncbi:MAG: hypothetical protein GQ559_07745 [Desulfobulbaceae bacterium]|nr:hypothetical protein [Desulfobulbaceae bacterium]